MDLVQLLQSAARAADFMAAGAPGTHHVVARAFGPWLTRLTASAVEKWLPRLAAQIPCEVPRRGADGAPARCGNVAIATCDVCGRPVCLEHSRVDFAGAAICFPCVARAAAEVRGGGWAPPAAQNGAEEARRPPPRPVTPDELARAHRRLGVALAATDAEVRAAWRRKSARWHPDRKDGDEAKFKAVQAAYDVIARARG